MVLATVAVLVIVVPLATLSFTRTTRVKTCGPEPAASNGLVQVMVPVPPTAGIVQVNPGGEERDWKVVPVGMVSVRVTLAASEGPLLVTVIV